MAEGRCKDFFNTNKMAALKTGTIVSSRLCLKCDGTYAETRFRLSAKRTSPFKSAGASLQSTTGSRVMRISGSNAGYTMFRGSVKGTGYHSICQFSLHFPSLVSPCAITFQLDSTCSSLCTSGLRTYLCHLRRSLYRTG
jgi:hypothetical protein